MGIFPLGFRNPPPLPKVGKNIFFLFDIWCLKSNFVQRIFFLSVSPVLGVDAPKIRDPSLNLGVGTPNIGDPSPNNYRTHKLLEVLKPNHKIYNSPPHGQMGKVGAK